MNRPGVTDPGDGVFSAMQSFKSDNLASCIIFLSPSSIRHTQLLLAWSANSLTHFSFATHPGFSSAYINPSLAPP